MAALWQLRENQRKRTNKLHQLQCIIEASFFSSILIARASTSVRPEWSNEDIFYFGPHLYFLEKNVLEEEP